MICPVCGKVNWSRRVPPLYPPTGCKCIPAHKLNLRQRIADEKAKRTAARAAARQRGVQVALPLEDPS